MKSILFITSNRLGDAVLSTGVLANLLAQYPGAQITVVCGQVPAGLFDCVPGIKEIIVLEKQPYSLHWWKMWRRCFFTFWDVVVDLRNAPLSYFLFAKRQIHLGRADKQNIHRVRALGSVLGLADNPPAPMLWTNAEHEKNAATLMDIGANNRVLVLCPTANWTGKTWPPERFVDLALRLSAPDGILPGAMIAVIAHSSESDKAAPVLDGLPPERTINLVGDLPLLSVYSCLKRAAFVICNDSGLMHMAATSGVPTLGLFGPSREEHYAPWGNKCLTVRGDKNFQDAIPSDYDWQAMPSLMLGLSVKKAETAARELWNKIK